MVVSEKTAADRASAGKAAASDKLVTDKAAGAGNTTPQKEAEPKAKPSLEERMAKLGLSRKKAPVPLAAIPASTPDATTRSDPAATDSKATGTLSPRLSVGSVGAGDSF